MKPILSPKELADAIGVSESSLKRWADSGKVRVSRTAGGHRRIHIAEAVRFIRETGSPVVRPDILGLPDMGAIQADLSRGDTPEEMLFNYLSVGDAPRARGLIMSLYLSGDGVAAIADGPIRNAMRRLGELWEHDPAGIFIEHRATDMCIEAVRQLRLAIATNEAGPIAVGGAPPGDTYALPSLLAATVLAAEGFRAFNLGPQTPLDALAAAAEQQRVLLVWVSMTYVPSPVELERGISDLAARLGARGVKLAVGGQKHATLTLPRADNVFVGHSLAELAAFARGLLAARPADNGKPPAQ